MRTEIFLRSLLIQSSFNNRGLQNLGFCFSLLPLIRNRQDPDEKKEVLERSLERFNTHPYLASAIVGAVLNLEGRGSVAASEEALKLKNMLAGPYAAIGDSFFWNTLRYFSSVFAVILALTGSFTAVLAFLLLFNVPHLYVRYRGYAEGLRQGKKSVEFIKALDLPGSGGRIRRVSLILTGILVSLILLYSVEGFESSWSWPGAVAVFAFMILSVHLMKRGFSRIGIFYGTFGAAAITASLWY